MMKTIKLPSAVATITKCNGLVFGAILSIFLIAPPPTHAVDIFATPTPPDTTSIPYPTKEAFLAATKTGEIPKIIFDYREHPGTRESNDGFHRSLNQILQNECGFTKDDHDRCKPTCFDLIYYIGIIELTGHDLTIQDQLTVNFRQARKDLTVIARPKPLEAFDAFAKQYSKAVEAYLIVKQDQAEQRQVAAEKVKQKEEASERQAQLERDKKKDLGKQQKAIEDARNASLAAEEATKAEAIKDARDAQEKDRATKLQEFMQSPPYKLWQASLKVVAGLQMIQKAQNALNHDNAVTRESDVSNLTERRAAGEDIVAGKQLVEKAFADYKRLGGPSATPEEVVPGPDPAAQYR